jgi:hypothetical protein
MKVSDLSLGERRGQFLFGLDRLAEAIVHLEAEGNKLLSVDILNRTSGGTGSFIPTGKNIRLTGAGFGSQPKALTFVEQLRSEFGEDVAVVLNTEKQLS